MKIILFVALALTACLEPQVSDEVPATGAVLPPGTELPFDDALDQRIADNDGVDGYIPMISGFADGAPAQYWNFGPAPEFVAPIWKLARVLDEDQGTFEMLPHPTILDSVPGEPNYTPFWLVVLLPVTDAYNGEIIPSASAIEEAQRIGLVGPPVVLDAYANCPVTARDVLLNMGPGQDPVAPTVAFYRGMQIFYYNFTMMRDMGVPTPLTSGVTLPVGDLYRLRREGGEPLSEPWRNVDMTGDGDIDDSNDILSAYGPYSPLRRLVSVTVPVDYISIDDTQDQTMAGFQDGSELFQTGVEDLVPISDQVVSFQDTESLLNLPMRTIPGT